jgi:hypothetical protein
MCALLRAKCATYPGPDGLDLVFQEVRVADNYGQHCHADQGLSLMPFFVFGSEISDESHENLHSTLQHVSTLLVI